jgi:uncharacterized membrane protein YcgQ (UPF0703/DUF1980 family)
MKENTPTTKMIIHFSYRYYIYRYLSVFYIYIYIHINAWIIVLHIHTYTYKNLIFKIHTYNIHIILESKHQDNSSQLLDRPRMGSDGPATLTLPSAFELSISK